MITLRPHQVGAVDAIENAYRAGINRPLVDACVGSGKSLMMAETARRNWTRGERTLILAHTRELVRQNAAACAKLGLNVGINAAALGQRDWRHPVISASIQSVYNKPQAFGVVANILTDECFPPDTLISTPQGDRRIGSIKEGDEVFNALGVGKVEAKSTREAYSLVEIEFDDGTKIQCTPNHPLFTLQGWTVAGRLDEGSCIVCEKGMHELRFGVWTDSSEWADSQRTFVETAALLLNILFKEDRERYERSCDPRTTSAYLAQQRPQAADSRRERSSIDKATIIFASGARSGMGDRVSGSDWQETRERLSTVLQDRHCASIFADSDRSGWRITPRETTDIGREKRRFVALARVARVSPVKFKGTRTVCNLQVSGHPSYFANGLLAHNCHLIPHAESGMYREFHRGFPGARMPGFSGTVFRLQGGSLVEGEGAPFDRVVYTYSILDGIRDGYLVPAFSAPAADQIDVSKLRKAAGEYSPASQDAQMLALMDSHIAQMVHHGAQRRAWLVFEASVKAANAMVERLRAWGIAAAAVTDKTSAGERERAIAEFSAGRLRCLVNVAALTTGFDAPGVDMLVMRRRTTSLGLYIQMTGRALRTIGGNIEASITAGKPDALVLDFAGNIDQHGPLDFIRPKDSRLKLVSCEACNARNAPAAVKCWSCDEPMTKLCPACLANIQRGTLDCPHCGHDMRTGGGGGGNRDQHLLEKPSGAALIAAFKPRDARAGGWIPIKKAWSTGEVDDVNGKRWNVADGLRAHIGDARWIREDGTALLKPNGGSRTSALQITADGGMLPVPMPAAAN